MDFRDKMLHLPILDDPVDSKLFDDFTETNFKSGQLLSHPENGEEIVISGLAGMFPDSRDVYHFRQNLYDKIDMISGDDRRWLLDHPEIPQRGGKLYDIQHFDAGYFGIHFRQAHAIDPVVRLFLERAIEAIMDAGINPKSLEGTKTGVYVGACFSETDKTWFLDKLYTQYFAITGLERSMIPNRLSYFLKLQGPSHTLDTACSSSLYALDNAYRALRSGAIDQAIVGGTNLCLHPFVSLQFSRLGVLSKDGTCKVFQDCSDGYVRSEAVAAILLQKSKDAKRIYAQVIHAKTNCDGYKQQGITFPSSAVQKKLLGEFYMECGIDPTTLSYLEAHGTGTKVGDPEEVEAIDAIFCKSRKTPLLVGSVKSNLGHSEPSSGLCSVAKVILAMENGLIPPNLHFTKAREGVEALEKGRLQIVTEKTPFKDNNGLIGINSFGFGGGNCHVLLKWNTKVKDQKLQDHLPRLVCVSGRTEEAIKTIQNDLGNRPLDVEFVRLLQDLFSDNFEQHHYRGYSILTKNGELCRSSHSFLGKKQKLFLAFTDFYKSWTTIVSYLNVLPQFAASLMKIANILSPKVNFNEIFKMNDIFAEILGNVCLQLSLCDLMNILNIKPDGYFGYGISELVCGYFDKAITLEEAVWSAYYIAKIVTDTGKTLEVQNPFAQTKAKLLKVLHDVIKTPKKRSNLWLSSNTTELASAEYFITSINLYFSADNFREKFGNDAVILEIGTNELKLKQPNITLLSFESCKNFVEFLQLLGRLYEYGHNTKIEKLYPKVAYPVSRGTPMISPLVKWDRSHEYFVTHYTSDTTLKTGEKSIRFSLREDNFKFFEGHLIDGRALVPAAGYLYFAWELLCATIGMMLSDVQIVFENCKFLRAVSLTWDRKTDLNVTIQRGTGNFEIVESKETVVTGRLYLVNKDNVRMNIPVIPENFDNSIKLSTKDVYKELKLRGYNYKGSFKRIKQCNKDVTCSSINWDGNWISFIDNMFQMRILEMDTRLLYVPTSIEYLSIDAKAHIAYCQSLGDNPNVPVYYNKHCDLIRSGYIEIRGLFARSIQRRKNRATPVLEEYKFIPNRCETTLASSIRFTMQLIMENLHGIKVKIVELLDDASNLEAPVLSPFIIEALGDLPLIRPEVKILSKTPLEGVKIPVEDQKLVIQTECSLVVVSKGLQRSMILKQSCDALKTNGFIISREDLDTEIQVDDKLDVLTIHKTDIEQIVLIRKHTTLASPKCINIDNADFSWIEPLQKNLKESENIVVYSQNQPLSGILGFTNCLRREPNGSNVKAVFILDPKAPPFDPNLPLYKEQLTMNLAINVLKDSQWGTYRHSVLPMIEEVECEHCYNNITVRGDLSSMKWFKGPLTPETIIKEDSKMISIYYSAVNFRDIMTSTGKINADVITRERISQHCVQGFEFSGRTSDGKRVFGMTLAMATANLLKIEYELLWDCPDWWSLEDAATIPVVYGTVLFAFFMTIKIKKGNTILIHAGSGGIGQAAIQVALHVGCKVFTTVSTKEKREFVKSKFPQLKDNQIGNSRDISFEQMIYTQTEGRGVDVVLNSLAEEKLEASLRCLAKYGDFLEIGKFDLASNNPLRLLLLKKEANFHGIQLDALFNNHYARSFFHKIVGGAINDGMIRPIERTVFREDQVEDAYRLMAQGKHVGKVLIQIRKEEQEKICKPSRKIMKGIPIHYCDPDKVQIICGGLGGFGLELSDWLILRGARKIVLVSKNGLKNGYQEYRINFWRQYGTTVHFSMANITTQNGCEALFKEALELGEVQAIYNLAVQLKDALFENQTKDNFIISLDPKAHATLLLDELSRKYCPNLQHFVVFSSVSCGRGNPGQTNYGMANSIMERICEKRKLDGYPAIAIQWGAIGDVGLVADMQELDTEIEIGGTLQQKISNCLETLDILLNQTHPVVGSMVVAEKKGGAGGAESITEAIAGILGIRDIKTVSQHATLPELGMDSMSAVEIKQTLEREFDVFLTPQDMRNMTFARLLEIQEEKLEGADPSMQIEPPLVGFNMMLQLMSDEEHFKIRLVEMKSKVEPNDFAPIVWCFPGIEGSAQVLIPLAYNLKAHVYTVQYPIDREESTIEAMAQFLFTSIEEKLSKDQPFYLIGYSWGVTVTLEVASILEGLGYHGTIFCIDGSPFMLQNILKFELGYSSEAEFETEFLLHLLSLHLPLELIMKHRERIFKCATFDDRLKVCAEAIPNDTVYSTAFWKQFARSTIKRLKALQSYQTEYSKLKSKISLFKPEKTSLPNMPDDYLLQDLCEQEVEVKKFSGNHVTILDSLLMADVINEQVNVVTTYAKQSVLADEAGKIAMAQIEVKQI